MTSSLVTTVRPGFELTWLLSSCALDPALDGILLFDRQPQALLDAARAFVSILELGSPGRPVRRVLLGSEEPEDALWSSLRVGTIDGTSAVVQGDGLLVRGEHEGPLVVVVPDLARLGLPASRAATAMLGSPVTSVERQGRSRSWATRTYWLASCAAAEAGRVSPHLMDRFTARMPATRPTGDDDPADAILRALADESPARPEIRRPTSAWRAVLADAAPWPAVGEAAVARALDLHTAGQGMRRPLALLRLARTTALLSGAERVGIEHVEEAAFLTGLAAPTLRAGTRAPRRPAPTERGDRPVPEASPRSDDGRPAEDLGTRAVVEPVLEGPPAETLPTRLVDPTVGAAYPEDRAPAEREAAPLQVPWQRRAGRPSDRGAVLGTCQARTLRDIAWFDTVRHAACFQRFRSPRGPGRGIHLAAADLRAYRRAPLPEHLLVLVLDHTCRRGWDWLSDLAPYLHEAYVARASVCLVQVGGAGAGLPLRAERAVLRGPLDARLPAALDRPSGAATPLAHGLELARTALRHALQHGSATVSDAHLVVVTDGLGNVPLAASVAGAVAQPVAGEGVADALAAAGALRELHGVRVSVVEPPGARHPDVLLDLVTALADEQALIPTARREP